MLSAAPKDKNYRKIYGCPRHGNINGNMATMTIRQDLIKVERYCYICNICKTIFQEPTDGKLSDPHKIVQYNNGEYHVQNVVGPVHLPTEIYVHDSIKIKYLCDCKESANRRIVELSSFLLKNGEAKSVKELKKCNSCKKIFISRSSYNKNKTFFETECIKPIFIENPLENADGNCIEICANELIGVKKGLGASCPHCNVTKSKSVRVTVIDDLGNKTNISCLKCVCGKYFLTNKMKKALPDEIKRVIKEDERNVNKDLHKKVKRISTPTITHNNSVGSKCLYCGRPIVIGSACSSCLSIYSKKRHSTSRPNYDRFSNINRE